MENFISVTHVTQKLFKERLHVRQLLTIIDIYVDDVSTELESLKKLEQVIIA